METWKKNVRLQFLISNFVSVFSYKKPTENSKFVMELFPNTVPVSWKYEL
jgi:hypothetical protein